jgi:hypothetical protein
MPDMKFLLIDSHGGVPLAEVEGLLGDLGYAYNGLYVFRSAVRRMIDRRDAVASFWPYDEARLLWPDESTTLTRGELEIRVPRESRLQLDSVRLESPGWWKFLGVAPVITAISQFLDARQQRREFERAEPHRRTMEKQDEIKGALETLLGVDAVAKTMGIPIEDLTPMINLLVDKPLGELGKHVDAQLIHGTKSEGLPEPPQEPIEGQADAEPTEGGATE